MAPVRWTDVRPKMRHPVQAHDGVQRGRRVEMRVWHVPAEERPYQLRVTLIDKEAVIETWQSDHSGLSVPHCMRRYENCRYRAERWLEGWPLDSLVRPGWAFGSHRKGPDETPGPESE